MRSILLLAVTIFSTSAFAQSDFAFQQAEYVGACLRKGNNPIFASSLETIAEFQFDLGDESLDLKMSEDQRFRIAIKNKSSRAKVIFRTRVSKFKFNKRSYECDAIRISDIGKNSQASRLAEFAFARRLIFSDARVSEKLASMKKEGLIERAGGFAGVTIYGARFNLQVPFEGAVPGAPNKQKWDFQVIGNFSRDRSVVFEVERFELKPVKYSMPASLGNANTSGGREPTKGD